VDAALVPIDVMGVSSSCVLTNLLSRERAADPADVKAQFLRDVFMQRPLVVRGDATCLAEIQPLLFDFDVGKLVASSASDQVHVWLSYTSSSTGASGLESIGVEDPAHALKLYHAGHSLYCRAPRELEDKVVPRLLDAVGMGLVGSGTDRFRRGEIEMFFSRRGHLTDFHTDFQENFTVQLSGTKKWTFRDSTATFPLRGCTPHYKALHRAQDDSVAEQQLKVLRLGDPAFCADQFTASSSSSGGAAGTHEVVLQPGDVMYHPAGIWHRVECLEDSFSINVSLICSSAAEVFCAGLQQLLWENPQFRRAVGSGAAGRAQSLATMQAIMDSVPALLRATIPEDFVPLPCSGVDRAGGSSKGEDDEGDEADDDEEEDDDDEEEDAEESATAPPPIRAADVVVPRDQGPVSALRFRINPLVQIISSGDLDKFRGSSSSSSSSSSRREEEVYVCHSSFGNETLESVLRQPVVVTARMAPVAAALQRRVQAFKSGSAGGAVAYADVKGSGSADDVAKVLWAFVQAGALTVCRG
jgi:hypothetical protein